VDPAECVSDENCALKILDMFGTVFPLAIRDQYIVQVDEELFRRAVEKLLKLQPLPHSPALAQRSQQLHTQSILTPPQLQ
jgi:hypothetical protein